MFCLFVCRFCVAVSAVIVAGAVVSHHVIRIAALPQVYFIAVVAVADVVTIVSDCLLSVVVYQ